MTPSHSIWSPLRQPAFRGLWLCGAVFFIGAGMQTMAAAWLMVELTGSSFLAALVQTAVFLPMFLLALPAGVLADTTDRRRLISGALIAQVVACVLLAGLVLGGWGGPASVLFLVFVCGCCTAVLTPAWNSSVIDPVPRDEWPQAITAIGIAYNAARAIGPTLAGLLFAWMGAGWVFVVTVFTTGVMWESIRRWPPKAHPPSRLPAERLWGGTLSGLRFAWHSRIILAQLVRVMAYSAAGSALWALLPVIAQRQLGTGAEGFGLLMGCLGTGAVASGLVIGRLRARFPLDAIVSVSCAVFAVVMLLAAWVRVPWVVYIAMAFGGAAWMATMSTFNTATQASAPPWVRSRAVALHIVSALGAFAIGSAFWGAVSDIAGLTAALVAAGVVMAAGGYPLDPKKGDTLRGLPAETEDCKVFHAGTATGAAGGVGKLLQIAECADAEVVACNRNGENAGGVARHVRSVGHGSLHSAGGMNDSEKGAKAIRCRSRRTRASTCDPILRHAHRPG